MRPHGSSSLLPYGGSSPAATRHDFPRVVEIEHVGCPDEGRAAIRLEEVRDHLEDTYFFRTGGTGDTRASSAPRARLRHADR